MYCGCWWYFKINASIIAVIIACDIGFGTPYVMDLMVILLLITN